MKIVYLSHQFYPEIGAPSARVLELSREWVKLGHQVTVVTCFPNHPTGIIPEQYRGRVFMEESYEGIRILRNFVYATPNKGVFKRTVSHLSFMVSSIILSSPRLGKNDVIIVTSPPFFTTLAGLVISWLQKCPFIFEVRDLWPAAIAQLGVVKSKAIIKILECLELFLYRKAKRVVVVTESYKKDLIRRGVPETKIEVIYNGVDPERFDRLDPLTVKMKYGLEGRFVVLYAGTHGLSHSLGTLIHVADRLRDREDLVFLFVGEGAMKKSLLELAEKLELRNVVFQPGQPREKIPEIYALADVCVVPLRKVELFAGVIPSKIFEILASGKPIIASLEGEAANILNRSGAAMVIPPEDQTALEQAISLFYKDEFLRKKMGEQGVVFVSKYFNRSVLAQKYETLFRTFLK